MVCRIPKKKKGDTGGEKTARKSEAEELPQWSVGNEEDCKLRRYWQKKVSSEHSGEPDHWRQRSGEIRENILQ